MVFKRKIYEKLLEWKNNCKGEKALLIEGARRIGKSTIVEEFAKKEYRSYILIDFNDVSEVVISAFENYLIDLDTFFLILATEYNVILYRRESLIIFDEIQNFPRARQSIKKLVKDGRYDYIETGSLISIKENVKNITIPSEERKIRMYPLDFEEFCLALNKEELFNYIKLCFNNLKPLEEKLHHKAMLLFKEYILIGGMPKVVAKFIENNNFKVADEEKRDILNLYESDINKINNLYKIKVLSIFKQIPSFLSQHKKRITLKNVNANSFKNFEESFYWLTDSMITNACFNSTDPNIGLSLNEERTYIKCYMGDTGLLVSLAISENNVLANEVYKDILNDRLSINKGMLFENVISQMLVANNHKLYYYNEYNNISHRNDIEIDFLLTSNDKNAKVIPIEVKSTKRYQINSLNKFINKYKNRIDKTYIIHPKNLKIEENIIYLPAYMTMFL